MKNALALAKGEVCQSSRQPSLDLLVRTTCGGQPAITDALREEMRRLNAEVCVEPGPALHAAASRPAANGVSLLPA